jgi:cysteine desulfuration protein SufE
MATGMANTGTNMKLDEIITEFGGLDFRERLELLLDFAENLPPLPADYEPERDAGLHRVAECQTPVFIWVDVLDGRVRIHAYVAPEAPTVKGFVGVLVEAFDGSPPDQVLAAPANLLDRMGLAQALGMTRLRGLNALVHRLRKDVREAAALQSQTS